MKNMRRKPLMSLMLAFKNKSFCFLAKLSYKYVKYIQKKSYHSPTKNNKNYKFEYIITKYVEHTAYSTHVEYAMVEHKNKMNLIHCAYFTVYTSNELWTNHTCFQEHTSLGAARSVNYWLIGVFLCKLFQFQSMQRGYYAEILSASILVHVSHFLPCSEVYLYLNYSYLMNGQRVE